MKILLEIRWKSRHCWLQSVAGMAYHRPSNGLEAKVLIRSPKSVSINLIVGEDTKWSASELVSPGECPPKT